MAVTLDELKAQGFAPVQQNTPQQQVIPQQQNINTPTLPNTQPVPTPKQKPVTMNELQSQGFTPQLSTLGSIYKKSGAKNLVDSVRQGYLEANAGIYKYLSGLTGTAGKNPVSEWTKKASKDLAYAASHIKTDNNAVSFIGKTVGGLVNPTTPLLNNPVAMALYGGTKAITEHKNALGILSDVVDNVVLAKTFKMTHLDTKLNAAKKIGLISGAQNAGSVVKGEETPKQALSNTTAMTLMSMLGNSNMSDTALKTARSIYAATGDIDKGIAAGTAVDTLEKKGINFSDNDVNTALSHIPDKAYMDKRKKIILKDALSKISKNKALTGNKDTSIVYNPDTGVPVPKSNKLSTMKLSTQALEKSKSKSSTSLLPDLHNKSDEELNSIKQWAMDYDKKNKTNQAISEFNNSILDIAKEQAPEKKAGLPIIEGKTKNEPTNINAIDQSVQKDKNIKSLTQIPEKNNLVSNKKVTAENKTIPNNIGLNDVLHQGLRKLKIAKDEKNGIATNAGGKKYATWKTFIDRVTDNNQGTIKVDDKTNRLIFTGKYKNAKPKTFEVSPDVIKYVKDKNKTNKEILVSSPDGTEHYLILPTKEEADAHNQKITAEYAKKKEKLIKQQDAFEKKYPDYFIKEAKTPPDALQAEWESFNNKIKDNEKWLNDNTVYTSKWWENRKKRYENKGKSPSEPNAAPSQTINGEKGISVKAAQGMSENKVQQPKQPDISNAKPQEIEITEHPDYGNASMDDIAADLKHRGFDRYRAWDEFIKIRNLQPEVNAKEFYKAFDTGFAKSLIKKKKVTFQPNYIDTISNRKVQITPVKNKEGKIQYWKLIFEDGSTGTHPGGDVKGFKKFFKPLKEPAKELSPPRANSEPIKVNTLKEPKNSVTGKIQTENEVKNISPNKKQPYEMTQNEWLKTPEGQKRYKESADKVLKKLIIDSKKQLKSKKYSLEDKQIIRKALEKAQQGKLEGFAQRQAELNAFGILDKKGHYEVIKKALEEGKKVPENVLKDYPHLAKEHSGKAKSSNKRAASSKGSRKPPYDLRKIYEQPLADFLKPLKLPKPSKGNVIMYHRLRTLEDLDSVLKNGLKTPNSRGVNKKISLGEADIIWGTKDPDRYGDSGIVLGIEVPKDKAEIDKAQIRYFEDIPPENIKYVNLYNVKHHHRYSFFKTLPEDTQKKLHRFEVERALKEGKTVPGEVLKDYPDLKKEYTNQPIAKSNINLNDNPDIAKLTSNAIKTKILPEDFEKKLTTTVKGKKLANIIQQAGITIKEFYDKYIKPNLPEMNNKGFVRIPDILTNKKFEKVIKTVDKVADTTQRMVERVFDEQFEPGTVRESTSSILGKSIGDFKHLKAIAYKTAEENLKWWSTIKESQAIDIMDAIETNSVKSYVSGLKKNVANYIIKQTDNFRERLDRVHKLDNKVGIAYSYIKDYFPHIWDNSADEVRVFLDNYRRKVGNDAYAKTRTVKLIREGIKAGLKLKTTNLEELVTIREVATLNNIAKLNALNDMAKFGFATFAPKRNFKFEKPLDGTILSRVRTIGKRISDKGNVIYGKLDRNEIVSILPHLKNDKSFLNGFTAVKNTVSIDTLAKDMNISKNAVMIKIKNDWENYKNKTSEYYMERKAYNERLEKFKKANIGHKMVQYTAPDHKLWFMTNEAAQVFNDAFPKDSLWNQKDIIGKAFRTTMYSKNIYVAAKLGLSLFHFIHISTIKPAAESAMILQKMINGNIKKKDAFTRFAKTITFLDQYKDVKNGLDIKKAWSMPLDKLTPEMREKVQMIADGGGSPEMSAENTIRMVKSYKMANKSLAGKGFEFTTRMFELMQKPILDKYVPALKIDAYLKRVKRELEVHPEMSDLEQLKMKRKMWQETDAMFGQMVYDTLFWDKRIKEASQASLLSLGWQLGFVKTFGGAAIDASKAFSNLITGDFKKSNITYRMLYAATYTTYAALVGGLMTSIIGGVTPKTIADFFYPRVGGKNPDGTPRRVNTVFFTREPLSIVNHLRKEGILGGTESIVLSKANPVLITMSELLKNSDYYGYEISSSDNNMLSVKRAADYISYVAKSMLPISVTSAERTGDVKGAILSVMGNAPAPKYISETKIMTKIYRRTRLRFGGSIKTKESRDKREFRNAVLNLYYTGKDKEFSKKLVEGVKKGYIPNSLGKIKAWIRSSQIPPYLRAYKRLSSVDQKGIWNDMSKKDKLIYYPFLRPDLKNEYSSTINISKSYKIMRTLIRKRVKNGR